MSEVPTISPEEVAEKTGSEGFVLIDVLGEQSFERAHLPGAISISAHSDSFVEDVEAQVPEKDTEIVVYCSNPECTLSPQAGQKLIEAGYTNVKHYKGGLKGWAESGNTFEGAEAQEMQERLSSME